MVGNNGQFGKRTATETRASKKIAPQTKTKKLVEFPVIS
jgi:hypothetical protein